MRLRYLFFPTVLILAGFVFWGYVWPEIGSFKVANSEYATSQQSLQALRDKKSAMDVLSSKLNNDEQGNDLILSYLPKNKMEERIVNMVDYMASNSGVFLDNIGISANGAKESKEDFGLAPVSSFLSKATKENSSGVAGAGEDSAATQDPQKVQNVEVTISVTGDYEKMRMFFKNIQHMPIYNSIKSLQITSASVKDQKNDAVPAQAAASSSTGISANLIVNFGFLDQVRADNQKLAGFKAEIDEKTIQDLRAYVLQNIPEVGDSGVTTKGVNNPFLF